MILGILLATVVTSAQVPQWYTSHAHADYPAAEYLLGIGSGSGQNGLETAKKSALTDIISQLRVQVQSEMRTVTQSFAVNDDEQIYSDFRRQSRTMVNDEITGAEVAMSASDAASGTEYVLLVLDREKYAGGLRTELESGWKQAAELRSTASRFAANGRLLEAVQSITQIKQVLAPLFAKQVLHNAASTAPFASPSVFNPAALTSDIRSFLVSVSLEKSAGDKQTGKIGEKFPVPFTVTAKCNGVPCRGVTIVFLLDGRTKLAEMVTDEKGMALYPATVRNGASVNAVLSIPGLGREFDQNLSAAAAVFTWTAKPSDKAFAVNVNAQSRKAAGLVQTKLSSAVSEIGYKVVTMSGSTLVADVSTGVPGKIEGMAGTLYNITLTVTVSLKDAQSAAVLGTVTFSSRGVGKSEDEAAEKAANALVIDPASLAELLQK